MSELKWIRADWPAPRGVVAGTTLREGGVSRAEYASLNLAAHVGDVETSVATNRRRFESACELPTEPLWLTQVHGKNVVLAERAAGTPKADAIVSNRPGTVCAVLTADCLPVLLVSADGRETAAAHAGWRGLSGGVLEETVAAMATPASGLMAWFGPAISRRAFEVGGEVRDAFVSRDAAAAGLFSPNERGRWQADLYGLAELRLRQSGVTRIYGGGRCTFSEAEAFFSFRRDGECGRMATFVFRVD